MLLKASSQILRHCFSSYSKVMYDSWKQDPLSVHSTWSEYFQKNHTTLNLSSQSETTDPKIDKEKDLALSAYLLIRYYKANGHEIAELDPLSIFYSNSRTRKLR